MLALLENRELINAELDRRIQALGAEHHHSHRHDRLERDHARAQRPLRRLIDGYQEQLITLEELHARALELRKREANTPRELDALDTKLRDTETSLKLTETLDAFRARLTVNAEKLTIEQRQEIVRLVVGEVLLGDDDLTIRHSIPIPTNGQLNPPAVIRHGSDRQPIDPDEAANVILHPLFLLVRVFDNAKPRDGTGCLRSQPQPARSARPKS